MFEVRPSFRTASDRSSRSDSAPTPTPAERRTAAPQPLGRSRAVGDSQLLWVPGTREDGSLDWTTDFPPAEAAELPPLQAPSGVTALAGQVLEIDGTPLADVRLRIGRRSTTTDDTGRFLLAALPAGQQVLVIDGAAADHEGIEYPYFEVGAFLSAGRTNPLGYTIWMPRLDTAHMADIASPVARDRVIHHPLIPGLELRLDAGARVIGVDGRPVRRVGATPVPRDRPPFPLTPDQTRGPYLTLQPGGARITLHGRPGGGELRLPPAFDATPGAVYDLFAYDPAELGWHVYGQGEVDTQGRVVPLPGVTMTRFSCVRAGAPSGAPPNGPPPAGPAGPGDPGEPQLPGGGANCGGGSGGGGGCDGDPPAGGDPVDLYTGLFVHEQTDLVVRDVMPAYVKRVYRQNDNRVRAFGVGATHPFDVFIVGDDGDLTFLDVILPDGGRIRFEADVPGGGAGAVYSHTATPSRFLGAEIRFRSAAGPNSDTWDLTFKDGTLWRFYAQRQPGIFPTDNALIEISDRNGNRLALERDAGQHNRLTRILTPHGRFIDLTYHGTSPRIATATDHTGRQVTYGYDSEERLKTVTDPLGHTFKYGYDAADRMKTLTDARGNLFLTNHYDPTTGRVEEQTLIDGARYQFDYFTDTEGRVTRTELIDARGFIRRLDFNAAGYPTADTRALGTVVEQRYSYLRNPQNQLIFRSDPLGRLTFYRYFPDGDPMEVTQNFANPLARTSRYQYGPFHQLSRIERHFGETTEMDYDEFGNLIRLTDASGRVTEFTHTDDGQIHTLTDGLGHTWTFDYQLGDLTATTNPLGQTTRRRVDALGRAIATIDPLGRATTYGYNPLDRLSRVTDPAGGEISLAYDPNQNLTQVRDRRGPAQSVTQFVYDPLDRLRARIDPLNAHAAIPQRDFHGNIKRTKDRKGQITTRTYDALDRLTLITYADGTTLRYTWDAGNRLVRIDDSESGVIERDYDDLNRLLAERTPEGDLTWVYDDAARTRTLQVPGMADTVYRHDPAGRLIGVQRGDQQVLHFHDAAGRQAFSVLPDGVSRQTIFDDANRIERITYFQGGQELERVDYSYDAAGQRIGVQSPGNHHRLPPPLGAASYDLANRLTDWNGVSVSHDPNGNLTQFGSEFYGYDARDRLRASVNSGQFITYSYDGAGRRIRRDLNGGEDVRFHYQGANLLRELKPNGQARAEYLNGEGLDAHISRDWLNHDERHVYLTDAQNTTLSLVERGGSGTAVNYAYEPFGQTAQAGTDRLNRLEYIGRERDPNGLYYLRARYYHPRLQRFMAEDPIGFAGGDWNLYGYVGNSPAMYIDPTGEFIQYLPPIIAAIVVAASTKSCVEAGNNLSEGGKRLREGFKAESDTIDCLLNPLCSPPANENSPRKKVQEGFSDLADGISGVAKNTPGTSVTGPPPSSVIDIIMGGVSSVLSDL